MSTSLPQPMRPSGFAGRIFGALMNISNAKCFAAAFDRIAPTVNARVLEIGFGTGKLIERLAQATPQGFVAGVDPSALMLETARKRVRGLLHVDVREGDASRLPWPDGHFDAVAALHCWQFWADPQACLEEIRRVMKPGGKLVIILRDHGGGIDWLPNPVSRTGDETNRLCALLSESGFDSVKQDGRIGSSDIVIARRQH